MENIINEICSDINRRITTMDYSTESEIREYLSNNMCKGKLWESDVSNIADLLDVNTNCITDLLTDIDVLTDLNVVDL